MLFRSGKVYVNTADINFTLPVADAVLDRICRLVIRWDKTANTATAQLLMGDLGSSPTAPARSKTDELYDLVLCDYLVAHGDLAATAANLTDQRLNEDLCGLMRDGVTRIPTAALEAQVSALLDQLRTAIEQAASGQIADGTITTPKYANKSVTAEKLANDIPYTKFGLVADQVRNIYTGTSETPPAEWQPGDVYLQYSV